MNNTFTIGDFCFRLICPGGVTPPENFLKFRGGERPVYTYTIEVADSFPEPTGKILAQRHDLLVTRTTQGECRYIGVKGRAEPYAYYQETSADTAHIMVRAGRIGSLQIDPMFVSLLALERRLAKFDGMVLHCAFVEYRGQAILFSAPSETGKTTQANLWQKCRGAEVVNGDRALIQRKNGIWYARGWPVCGSSGVCHKRDLSIGAIVMLSQAPVDTAEKLSPSQAFTQLYSQITINRWNREENLHIIELMEQLVAEIPVYHLACTMNDSAVTTLEKAMK